jgi:3-isopropylmalate dehydratase small subunit
VCAASSFSLAITDPRPFLEQVDFEWFDRVYRRKAPESSIPGELAFVEPDLAATALRSSSHSQAMGNSGETETDSLGTIRSTIITLEDHIDTDALAPGPTLTSCVTDEEFGAHCLEHTHPDFRDTVRNFDNSTAVVVAGHGFGVGSSRENAVSALKGAGVVAVICKSFAFILGRNMPSLGLLGIVLEDESFYAEAKDRRAIEVDVPQREVRIDVEGQWMVWEFQLSEIEYQLTLNKGIAQSYKRYGKGVWQSFMAKGKSEGESVLEAGLVANEGKKDALAW